MTLAERDKECIWHPYTQMKNALPIIPIVSGKETLLFDESGKSYIDAVSSWWTNLHGHSNEYIAKKMSEQGLVLEHVIFAGFTHKPAIELAERLLKILPSNQKKVFYSDNGSTAVEVAIKMAIQYWYNRKTSKKLFIAFENAYHGDTFGAMSISGRSSFTAPFSSLLFDVLTIPVPSKGNEKKCLEKFNEIILNHKDQLAGFIFEPLVQGTAGMVMYSEEILDSILSACNANNIFTIADEVMTGFGRTGKMFASDYLKVQPDIFCLSKGITGGFMPFGVTTCSSKIYYAFLSEDKMKTFFHGHSYTANPLACVVSLASLDLMESEVTSSNILKISNRHEAFKMEIQGLACLSDVRIRGTILAIEIKVEDGNYFSNLRDKMYLFFIDKGILLRPLGNILYILPPYCISDKELDYVYSTILQFLKDINKPDAVY
jgi:adenosylmethionine---8-amino-7-oxononanoate aminotransferase